MMTCCRESNVSLVWWWIWTSYGLCIISYHVPNSIFFSTTQTNKEILYLFYRLTLYYSGYFFLLLLLIHPAWIYVLYSGHCYNSHLQKKTIGRNQQLIITNYLPYSNRMPDDFIERQEEHMTGSHMMSEGKSGVFRGSAVRVSRDSSAQRSYSPEQISYFPTHAEQMSNMYGIWHEPQMSTPVVVLSPDSHLSNISAAWNDRTV